jgi:hypothetical protein
LYRNNEPPAAVADAEDVADPVCDQQRLRLQRQPNLLRQM